MTRSILHLATLALLAACGGAADAPDQSAATSADPTPVMAASAADADLPTILVYKTEGCGCCNGWVEHLQAAGFQVDARNVVDLMSVKRDAGVPVDHSSCHTALVDGYVVEGHVPADIVKRMLAERPEIAGIAVPGMPIGSPGMEGPGARPYEVRAFDGQGGSTVYAEVDPR
jgi:hypothetical protein